MTIQPPTSEDVIERVRIDYCAGVLSLREVGYRHKVSHAAVSKWARIRGWSRNLQPKINARANQLVNKAALPTPVVTLTPAQQAQETATVEANAQLISDIKLRHRSDVKSLRDEVAAMVAELKALRKAHAEANTELAVPALNSDAAETQAYLAAMKRREEIGKTGSLDKRVTLAQKLADSMSRLITMERVAFGIQGEENKGGDGSYEDLLRAVLEDS